MKTLALAAILTGNLLLALQLAAIDYPHSHAERQALDEAFERILARKFKRPDKPMGLLVDQERQKLLERSNRKGAESQDELEARVASLLERYSHLFNVSSAHCDEDRASELIMLLKLHSDSTSAKLYKYLQERSADQFGACKPDWDRDFLRAVEELDERYVEKMGWLLDSLLAVSSSRGEPHRAPYSQGQLARVSSRPPPAGLVLYMSRFQVPLGLDENMKNPKLSYESLKQISDRTIQPLCRPVCTKLRPVSQIYRFAYSPQLNRDLLQTKVMSGTSNKVNQWLASKMICCALIDEHKAKPILRQVHAQIVDEPQSYIDTEGRTELELSDLIANSSF